jgi:hypothetical protein
MAGQPGEEVQPEEELCQGGSCEGGEEDMFEQGRHFAKIPQTWNVFRCFSVNIQLAILANT